MSKETVAHRCGHEAVHRLHGPHRERDRRAAWLATTDCADCYRARMAAEAEARRSAEAAEAEEVRSKGLDAGLAPLAGSPGLVARATPIRVRLLADLFGVMARAEARVEEARARDDDVARLAEMEAVRDRGGRAYHRLRALTEARFWASRGDETPMEVLRAGMRLLDEEATR